MKKSHRLFLFGWLLVPGVVRAQATVRIGPRLGLGTATARYQSNPHNAGAGFVHAAPMIGAEAGVQATVDRGHWSLQPAVLWAQKGFGERGEYPITVNGGEHLQQTVNMRNRLNYVAVPVNVAYALRADGHGWQAFAGGYAAALLGGRTTGVNTTDNPSGPPAVYQPNAAVRPGKEYRADGRSYFYPYDWGVQAGLGYRYRRVLGQATYAWGLANGGIVFPRNTAPVREGPRSYNRTAGVSLGYLFGGPCPRP